MSQIESRHHEGTPVRLSDDAEIHAPFSLEPKQIAFYREQGFVKIPGVFSAATLEHYGAAITDQVVKLNPHKKPLVERSTYHRAFIQVTNLWEKHAVARAFVLGRRLGRIAAELMGVNGVRLYHDQALYKEPGGGFTPWHADQQYWPLASDKSVTAWVPLQETPMEMGPLTFAAKSQKYEGGRSLAISDESEQELERALGQEGFTHVQEPFSSGEVSFHSGWTYHRAGPNNTDRPRAVMTIIYMDAAMRLAEPANDNQAVDRDVFCPGIAVGEIIDSEKNPVIYGR